MKQIDLFVAGTPKPQGRPRAFSRGKFTTIYSPTTDWKESIKWQASKLDVKFEDEALMVHLSFYFERPKSHLNSKGDLRPKSPKFMTSRPDLDNLAKAVLDALQDAGILKDDSKIVLLKVTKRYADHLPQGVRIFIEEVE